MKKIELLSPAKNIESGLAAINSGADAIYIGAPKFSARTKAGNSINDIEKLVQNAHQYRAKVYVAFNILLFDNEFPEALKLIDDLYDVGIDGLIIQDMGLLECDLPPVPLIASTQMHNSTKERIIILEQIGFQRAILARELSLDQISDIRQNTKLELEAFVHGALCVCYSGQCYMSYALGGRSGNRGDCAQPCRLKYSLFDRNSKSLVENRYLLSLKDLNLSQSLGELLDAGITTFKIEGRLKDAGYVTNVVSYYRQKLDAILDGRTYTKSSSGKVIFDFIPDIDKTFNRGYTDYYLHGKSSAKGSIDSPKMVGQFVGKIISMSKLSITLDRDCEFSNGDGICFFDENNELKGTVLNSSKGRELFLQSFTGLKKGTSIYRNHDHLFISKLMKSGNERKISVWLSLSEDSSGYILSAIDEDGNQAQVVNPSSKAVAVNSDKAVETIEKQLSKTGNTIFHCSKVEINLHQVYFISVSDLNAMRRSVLEKLLQERFKNYPMDNQKFKKNNEQYFEKELTFLGNVLNKKSEAFYHRHGVENIEPAAESGLEMSGKRVMRTRYCILHQLGKCKLEGNKFEEPLYLINENREKFELRFDCQSCEMEVYYIGKIENVRS